MHAVFRQQLNLQPMVSFILMIQLNVGAKEFRHAVIKA
jgi:hypothetical protein